VDTALDAFVRPDLIIIGLQAKSKEDVIRHLAALLQERGYVTDDYADAVLERERGFPTGLPTVDVHVAIPHTDTSHCLKPGIAVAILAQPVEFGEMATRDKTLFVDIVFLLAITDPKEQVKWLQSLIGMFQRPGLLQQLKVSPDPETCYQILRKHLAGKEVVQEKSKPS